MILNLFSEFQLSGDDLDDADEFLNFASGEMYSPNTADAIKVKTIDREQSATYGTTLESEDSRRRRF